MSTRAQQTAAQVREHRRFGLAKRRRKIPRQRYPQMIELEYAKAMIGMFARVRPAFSPLLAELPDLLHPCAIGRGSRGR